MNLVTIQLHGNIFEGIKKTYKLGVKSVSEAIHAVNLINQQRFYPKLLENDKKGIKYRILINGRDFLYEEAPTVDNPESVLKTELTMNVQNLETIDIVPVIEGGDSDIGAIIVGALMVIVGVVGIAFLGWTGVGAAIGVGLIIGGIGLIAAGVINLLTSPPTFEDFREIGGGGRASYLFSGPQNTVREGGPVPVGYGRLLVGSHVIGASYEISDESAKEELTV